MSDNLQLLQQPAKFVADACNLSFEILYLVPLYIASSPSDKTK